jgi:outer membrane protein OmpA-like peptidoglycan-associated protein
VNRKSPWLFETPTAVNSEYEAALLESEWEVRLPRRPTSQPPSRRPFQPVRRAARPPQRRPTRPRQHRRPSFSHRQFLPVGSGSSPPSPSSGTGSGILIATIDRFEFGSYLLKKHQFEQLHDLIIILNENKDSLANAQLDFNGHTDATGGDSKGNRSLAFRRALEIENFVRGFFRKEHPNLATRSRGRSSEEPIALNTTKDGQARNRRVEVFSDVPLQPAK